MISSHEVKWTFWDYCQGERNHIADWYKELSDGARFQFDSLLKNCSKTDNHLHWLGFRGYLKGKLKDDKIWEIGFAADKRQYRILGIFGKQSAVLLIGCYHKGKIYTPTDALGTAAKRAKTFRAGEAGVYERKINTDL